MGENELVWSQFAQASPPHPHLQVGCICVEELDTAIRLLRLEQTWKKACFLLAVHKVYICVLQLRILPSYNISTLKRLCN